MKAETVPITGPLPRLGDWVELAKPRITLMVLITVAAGAILAVPRGLSPLLLTETLLATGLLASAASALNQVLEARQDALMERTRERPLVTGRLDRGVVLVSSAAATALALLYLGLRVNALTALLGAVTSFAYLFVYTPLKRRTPFATLAGAVPGALPPVMGWAAARGDLQAGAWVLFAIVFLWQLPHFLSIAWMYREDYERGGFAVLPVLDPAGRLTATLMVAPTLLLLAVSLAAPGFGVGGTIGAAGGVLAGAVFTVAGLRFAQSRTIRSARRVLLTSVLYLPVALASILLGHLTSL